MLNQQAVLFSFDIQNEPASLSNATTLNVQVIGGEVGSYRYKVGADAGIDCASAEGYSSEIYPVATPIAASLASVPDGSIELCVVAANLDGQWLDYSRAVSYTWTKDTQAPSEPSALTLQNPTSSPSPFSQPTVRVSGVSLGDTVTLYRDSNCTTAAGSGTAAGTTIDVQVSPALTDGSYMFYAKTADAAGNNSNCSTASLAYVMDSSIPMAVINNAPSGTSSSTALNISISGVVAYRYKIITSSESCNVDTVTNYSVGETLIATPITDSISSFADGQVTVCVIGRNASGTWQPLSSASSATWTKSMPAVPIHRSVEAGKTTALDTGVSDSNALSIVGTTATFANPVPDQIGIGDAIQYDSDGDGTVDEIAFIHGRTSSYVFTLASKTGGTPTPTTSGGTPSSDTDWSTFRAYTSLANAEDGTENTGITAALRDFDTWSGGADLVANGWQWNIALYQGARDSGVVRFFGWNTDSNNLLKIFTPTQTSEARQSQRHIGVSGTGYHLDGSIIVEIQNMVISGLSIENRSSATTVHALEIIPNDSTESLIVITDNVIKQSFSSTAGYAYTLYVANTNAVNHHTNTAYVINNIIIDTVGSAGTLAAVFSDGNESSTGFDTNYFFNNTIYSGNGYAFLRNSANWDLRNNIFYAKNNAVAVMNWGGSGTLLTNANNASSDNVIAGGTSNLSNQTFAFFAEPVHDYRLSSTDAVAKNNGADLSANGVYNFSADIFGRTRSGAWDIGAVESATAIFRSVGFNSTSALASGGSNALTISGAQATFASALDADIGVGDAIQYHDGSQLRLAFINSRTSSTVYGVSDADGAAPSPVSAGQTWNIYRSYTNIAAALDGTENTAIDAALRDFDNYPTEMDLTTLNRQLNVAIYADAVDTSSSPDINSDMNTSPTNFLRIYAPYLATEVGQSQRHKGVWNSTSYATLSMNSYYGLDIQSYAHHLRIEGLQIENRYDTLGGGSGSGINVDFNNYVNSDVLIYGNLIRKTVGGTINTTTGIYLRDGSGVIRVFNNIVYGYYYGMQITAQGGYGHIQRMIMHNTTVANSATGIRTQNSAYYDANFVYNNISVNNGQGYSVSTSIDLINSANNISSDTTSPNASYRSLTPTFMNSTLSDYRLSPLDTVAKGAAQNLAVNPGYSISEDIARHTSHTSIGAYAAADAIYRSVGHGSTAALTTGAANNMSISTSCVVTFASALPDAVGVGDVIQYDSANGASIDSRLFIVSRDSSTQYRASNELGVCSIASTISNNTSWSIFRAYTSLFAFDAMIENTGIDANVRDFDTDPNSNLFSSNKIFYLALYADATLTGGDDFSPSFVTDDGNFVFIFSPSSTSEVGVSQRHAGVWNAGRTLVSVAATAAGQTGGMMGSDHVYVQGLQIAMNDNGHSSVSAISTGNMARGGFMVFDSNIVNAQSQVGISVGYDGENQNGSMAVVSHNVIVGSGANFAQGINIQSNSDSVIVNNTVYGRNSSDTCFVASATSSTSQILANNIAQNCATAYSGTYDTGTGYNLSSTGTATGQGSDVLSTVLSFVDTALINFNLNAGDVAALGTGTDIRSYTNLLSLSKDAAGSTWATPFDLGALQSP